MRKRICLVILALFLVCTGCSEVGNEKQIMDLRTNNMVNPVGIEDEVYFSWKMLDDEAGQKQMAYQLCVSDSVKNLEKQQYVWDSGKVYSNSSVAIPYEGELLDGEQEYVWKVSVWNKDEKVIESPIATFEIGKEKGSWENTSWIVSSKDEYVQNKWEAVGENKVSEICFDMKMEQAETGFIWGAKEGAYGEYYLWSFQVDGDSVKMKVSLRDGDETIKVKEEVALEQNWQEFLDNVHNIKIVLEDRNASTYLDGELISKNVIIENCEANAIGFWVERGEKNAWFDNISVRSCDNQILFEEDFETEKTIFSPYYLKIEEGWARADSGSIVTPGGETPAPMFRKEFEVEDKKIEKVRLYASALGIYDIYVNGIDINPYWLAPGQSVYTKEVYYRTFDVTEMIHSGENAVGIILGHGRYDRAKGDWGEQLALYAQLVIFYEDGTKQRIGTDDSWSVNQNGPIRSDDLFGGEYYDANYEMNGWSLPDFEERSELGWSKAEIYQLSKEVEVNPVLDEGVKCVEVIQPVSVMEPVEGVFVYDFGENINGVCNLNLIGKKGDTVTMRYGEYINSESLQRKDDAIGTIWTRNLCTADNTDYYVFGDACEVTYMPTFTYRGFRYLQITGMEEAVPIEEIQGMVISTDNERSGYFSCSDDNLNRLYHAIYRSQISNYVDIPTDCPQRDERLGWTGDAQVFAYTGALNANISNFMYKYIAALRNSQSNDGAYQQIVPFVDKVGGANGWSDAGIILVWEMYQQYGNKEIIRENLTAMCRYVDYLVNTSEGYIRSFEGYNDHNALSHMDSDACNTAQCAYVSGLLTYMCEELGEKELAQKYGEIYEHYVSTWRSNYLCEDGSIGDWLQSEYVMALAYGLYPEELEQAGADKLNLSITGSEYRISTGYVTTPHILSVLCKYGYAETAYKLIQQTEYPSWNYMLDHTSALTEGWNTLLVDEEGNIQINGSLNHVALGAVGRWFYTDVLGIQRDETQPGYKHFYLKPHIGGGLTWARGSYESAYGKIESAWEVTEEGTSFYFVIPPNTTATVMLPYEDYYEKELISGVHEIFIPNE